MHEPCRADQKELNVFKERRLLAFHFMTEKLADPRQHKNDQGYEPERCHVQSHDEVGTHKAEHSEKHHANTEGNGERHVIYNDEDQRYASRVGIRITRAKECLYDSGGYRRQQTDDAEKNKGYTNPMDRFVRLILMAFAVLFE